MKVLFRTDASHTIGWGHLSRCLSLANQLKEKGMKSSFILRHYDSHTIEKIKKGNHNYYLLKDTQSFDQETHILKRQYSDTHPVIVFDFCHYETMRQIGELTPYFENLRPTFKNLIVIDGFSDTAIIDKISPAVDIVVSPYFGALPQNKASAQFAHWAGPSYFIFQEEYLSTNWERKISETANNLLVSMGGSDPFEMSRLATDALKHVKTPLSVRIILGPSFSNELRLDLQRCCNEHHNWKAIESPGSLVAEMQWADMAVVAAGLTRYELAYAGLPSLQLSYNEHVAEVSAKQAKEGFFQDLGLYSSCSLWEMGQRIDALANDKKARTSMSRKGQSLFDELQAQKLIQAITRF